MILLALKSLAMLKVTYVKTSVGYFNKAGYSDINSLLQDISWGDDLEKLSPHAWDLFKSRVNLSI